MNLPPHLGEEILVQKIGTALKSHQYTVVGQLLQENIGTTITLKRVKQLARELRAAPLLRALSAQKALRKQKDLIKLPRGDFLQTALFIESSLQTFLEKKQYYLPKEQTSLPYALEYDARSKQIFIVLADNTATRIGHGANKIVTKSILYNGERSKVVARALQTKVKKKEIKMIHRLQGLRGIVDVLACSKYKEGAVTYRTIYSKFYRAGSLHTATIKKYSLSLSEKINIALNLLQGLKELHRKRIVHRDIAVPNCFVDIPPGTVDQRHIVAVLGDLGRAGYIWKSFGKKSKIQGHIPYTPPEGIFRNKFKKTDYYRGDVYALGCVLYNLFYDQGASWKNREVIADKTVPEEVRYNELVHQINQCTSPRRHDLALRKASTQLSPSETFEYLVLRMVDPDPRKRGSAKRLYKELSLGIVQK